MECCPPILLHIQKVQKWYHEHFVGPMTEASGVQEEPSAFLLVEDSWNPTAGSRKLVY